MRLRQGFRAAPAMSPGLWPKRHRDFFGFDDQAKLLKPLEKPHPSSGENSNENSRTNGRNSKNNSAKRQQSAANLQQSAARAFFYYGAFYEMGCRSGFINIGGLKIFS